MSVAIDHGQGVAQGEDYDDVPLAALAVGSHELERVSPVASYALRVLAVQLLAARSEKAN